jgi:hypothetical protein
VLADVGQMLASADPQPEFARGGTPADPPENWRLFEVKSLQLTPSFGGAPAAQSGGRATRGRPPGASDEESAGEASGAAGASGATRLSIDVAMTVETSNSNPGFVNSTLVKWLSDNANRTGMPYTLVAPDPQTISRTVASEPATGEAAAAGAKPAAPGAALGTGLDEMAPLAPPVPTFPPSARVYRYQIAWRINVLPPGQTTSPAAPAEGAEPSEEQASAAGMEG